jgi:prefoldin subunit 5
MTKLYQDLSRALAAFNEQQESVMQRLSALESTLSKLENASQQLRELS